MRRGAYDFYRLNEMETVKATKQDFEEIFEIMSEAFPPEEYRPKERQRALFDDERYTVYILREDKSIKGFLALWRLPSFYFAEHFAISSAERSRGLGSLFLSKVLPMLELPLVLEAENVNDDISKRRMAFYQRNGFTLTDICYNQPNFHKSDKVIPLRLMYAGLRAGSPLPPFKEIIFRDIYKKTEGEI